MKKPVFTGSCTAMVTPFGDDGGIDYTRMGKQLDFQAKSGTSAVLVCGTTGESPTLEQQEYEALVDFAVSHVAGRMKVLAGIGGNHTAACLRKAVFAQNAGVDAVMISPPYYNKTTQEGLKRHFLTVADRIDLPLILYNVPGRTVLGIAPETYAALAKHPNINGVKEASGDFSLFMRLLLECGPALNLWSGNDDQAIPMMALGGKGVVSVLSNLFPAEVSLYCKRCASGDISGALELYQSLAPLCRALFASVNPIPVKAALALLGWDSGMLRLPLVPLGGTQLKTLAELLETAHPLCRQGA